MNLAVSSTPAAPIAVPTRAPPAKAAQPPVSDESAAKAAEQLAASKKVAEDFRAARQDVRSMAKAMAREKVQRLRDELRLLQKLLAGHPKEFARQVTRIAKELRAAFKEFAAAHKGDVQDATMMRAEAADAAAQAKQADAETPPEGEDAEPAPAAAPMPAAPERSLESRRRAAGLEETPEAREMKDFIAELRGTLKKLREMLQEAKIKGGEAAKKQPGEKTDPFEDAEKELSELAKDLDRAFQAVSAEAKVFDAPGALVSVTA